MKRYLIEPASVLHKEPESAGASGSNTPAPQYKVIYRIMDTQTRQTVPPEGEDFGAVTQACTELNESDEKVNAAAEQLPDDIVQAIAINNAKSIGEQPTILANLALSQQIFNQNMQQQLMLGQQQAMNVLRLAAVAKCVSLIDNVAVNDPEAIEKIALGIRKIFKEMDFGIDAKAAEGSSFQAS